MQKYNADTESGLFSTEHIRDKKYAKMFSVNKSHTNNIIFSLFHNHTVGFLGYKRFGFIDGKLYDFDYDSSYIVVKVLEDDDNYYLYASINNTVTIKLSMIFCDRPSLIKFYPCEYPVTLPTELIDITNISTIVKPNKFWSISSLITINSGWYKTYPTQLILTDNNEVSGHLYIKGTHSGEGSVIGKLPEPLYINTESLFQTFCAMYKGTDNLWYGCTLRLNQNGDLSIYDLGENAPEYVSIKANLHYRCSMSLINKFLN